MNAWLDDGDVRVLREHLEAIRDERDGLFDDEPYEAYVRSMQRVYEHAIAALALLTPEAPK